jgi:hypothetical protein
MTMENPLAWSLWIGVALYASLGLFGIVAFHDATPSVQKLTDGYGVAYSMIAPSQTAK